LDLENDKAKNNKEIKSKDHKENTKLNSKSNNKLKDINQNNNIIEEENNSPVEKEMKEINDFKLHDNIKLIKQKINPFFTADSYEFNPETLITNKLPTKREKKLVLEIFGHDHFQPIEHYLIPTNKTGYNNNGIRSTTGSMRNIPRLTSSNSFINTNMNSNLLKITTPNNDGISISNY